MINDALADRKLMETVRFCFPRGIKRRTARRMVPRVKPESHGEGGNIPRAVRCATANPWPWEEIVGG